LENNMSRLRVAVIGVGHLGKEHARILAGMPTVDLVGVVDANPDQAQAVARRCGTQAFSDYWPLLNLVDAATIVVPTTAHHAIGVEFLRRGIPVLIEKPLAASLAEAQELMELAHGNDTLLQVGHIERFNPAFEELGRHPMQPKFVESQRLGPFSGRSTDIGVVLDLMIHDLDLMLAMVGSAVRLVEAVGVSVFGAHEDVANARLIFENGCIANITASRASPTAVRQMGVWAPEGYAGLNFAKRSLTLVQPSAELRHHGLDLARMDPASRAMLANDLFGRHLHVLNLDRNQGDQLTRELEHFVHCLTTGAKPRVGGQEACSALALAMRILESIRTHRWNGSESGPVGPFEVPAPLGPLFLPAKDEAAA
jgi:predicted dehydrogenase